MLLLLLLLTQVDLHEHPKTSVLQSTNSPHYVPGNAAGTLSNMREQSL